MSPGSQSQAFLLSSFFKMAAVEAKFKLTLYDYQKSVFESLKEGKDVFVCQRTGRGKSLCYLGYSTVTDGAIVLVLSPLNAIIEEQVEFLKKHGITACVLGKCDLSDVLAGQYQYIFTSPENLLRKQEHRDMLRSPLFQEKLGLIAVDECHVVVLWGESRKPGEDAFREWFGRVGEIRSLAPRASWIALTATASKQLRIRIKKKLSMNSCVEVIDSPDRENIKLFVKKIKASDDLDQTFRWLLLGLKNNNLDRTLVFCKTIEDCSRIYHFLKMSSINMATVEMFHSMTPPEVKQHIAQDMGNEKGRIKLLVCTNAAGMGVNYKAVDYVVNFGPPQEMDTFVQHVGRAGRDGKQSTHLLIFHGRQLRNVDKDMLAYAKSTKCRRASLLAAYNAKVSEDQVLHLCCDLCAVMCKCSPKCDDVSHPSLILDEDSDEDDMHVASSVSDENKERLNLLLTAYFDEESKDDTTPFSFLSYSETLDKVVEDIIEKVDVLKSAYDVKEYTLVSSFKTAQDVMSIIENVLHLESTVYTDSEDDDS